VPIQLDSPERVPESYDAALARFEAMLQRDTDAVAPASRSRLLGPAQRTQRAVVFFHGLSNTPQQFLRLAEHFTRRGYTVLLPRVPYHGYVDGMTTDQALLTAKDLVDTAAESVDLAAGLADEVTVSGISMGGILAIWAAQYRRVAVAAPIAPGIGVYLVPYRFTSVLFRILHKLPNTFVWWDPRVKAALPGPPYAYPRFSTHALVETQRLAVALMDAARQAGPSARTVWMITNAADLAVNNAACALLVRRWRHAGGANVNAFEFPRRLKLFHDLVDPLQPHAQPELVHPVLERIIADGAPPDAGSLRY
jgi:alpha-beta hydrolase superfamily lysophospholipase